MPGKAAGECELTNGQPALTGPGTEECEMPTSWCQACYISLTNQKVHAPTWSLPAIKTCPGSTPMCRRLCYARKAEDLYAINTAKPSRARNLQSTKSPRFVDMMTALVRSKTAHGFFRIHESGDFYSQHYLECWFEICRRLPHVRFLAFTKCFGLNWADKPANLRVIWSVWPDTDVATVPPGRRAYAGEFTPRRPTVECPGACDGCRVCWTGSQDVHFKIH